MMSRAHRTPLPQPLDCGNRAKETRRPGKSLGLFGCAMTLVLNACLADERVVPDPGIGQAAGGRSWVLKEPADDKVVFSGALDFEGTSVGNHGIVYPAPNAAAFLASVVTHGLIVGSKKSSQRKKAQDSADKVLEPYQSILETVSYRQLARRWADGVLPGSGRKLIAASESPEAGAWLIEAAPVFLMAQDQRTLSLEAAISIRAPGVADDAVYQGHIRVVSPAVETAHLAEAWAADGGRKLREVSAWLFSESMDIAMGAAVDGTGKSDEPFRTIRYLEGTTEKMERAQLVREHCGRLVIKTLRGSLMSVPARASGSSRGKGTEAPCAEG